MQKKSEIQSFFQSHDPVIAELLQRMKWEVLTPHPMATDYFDRLCRDIIAQQLSVKAAASILARFKGLVGKGESSAAQILTYDDQTLREVGLSWAKVKYIKDLAQKTLNQEIPYELFLELSDEEIINSLVQVKGIGRWTAEMFLLFTLGRENIFSYGDLGLKNGIKALYGKNEQLSLEATEMIVTQWDPFKSYASLAVWFSLDNT